MHYICRRCARCLIQPWRLTVTGSKWFVAGRIAQSKTNYWRRLSVLFGGMARAEDTLIRYRCLPRQLPYVMVRVENLGGLLGGTPRVKEQAILSKDSKEG